jgi:hypothetical protein
MYRRDTKDFVVREAKHLNTEFKVMSVSLSVYDLPAGMSWHKLHDATQECSI